MSNYDFLPSVLGYLDMSEELPTAPASPGRDFSPVLRGGDVPDWENAVFYEHETLRCVRTERWKLIERFEDGYDELYNLEQDPGELVNLYGREEVASVQKELESRLDTFFRKNVLAKYDLWNGGGSQTRLFDFGEEAKEREEARIATGLAPTAYDLSFNPPPFDLPKGYVAEVVAAPPLVEHPMMVSFDDRGRLFVAEASGVNLNKSELETALPNYVRLLEDTNNDGFYDKTSIFADNMTFPQGTLWLNGALYVASPPGIWKLVDHDDDGVADERIEIATGFDYTGNAADVHGPFLHPNGRIYWCHGRKGHEVHQADGEVVSANKGARIWSCKPDGSDIRVHAGGGMDNPVEITFTPEGEIIGSVNLFYGRPRGDVLVHWVLGGRYPRYDQGAVLEEFKSTGDPLTEIYNFGHVAVSGMTRTSDASIYTTLFNTQEVHKSTLQKSGSTYTASTEPFLKIRNPDVHLTDVMEDADGSLLVVDTGGWFRIGCPTSQLAKPEIPGAIYRIRKAGPDDWKTDWYGKTVNWAEASPKQLTDMLTDKRAAVRDRAVQELALRGDDAVAALGETLKSGEESAQIQAVWALTRIGTKDALQQIRGALKSENPALAMTACNSVIATRDPEAVAELIGLVTRPEADLRRTALTALGATGSAQGIPAIIGALENPEDRFLEHAAMYALIQLDQYEATRKAMPKSAAAQRRVYWALDQMDSSKLAAKDILTLLEEEELQETATAIAARHPEWAPEFASHFEAALAQPEKAQVLETLAAVGPSMVGEERMQAFVGKALGRDAAVKSVALEVIAESPTSLPLVESWKPAFSNLLANATGEELNQALKAVARLDSKAFGKELDAIAARDELPVRTRFLALRALQAGDTVNATGFALLLEMLKPDAAPADRAEAVALLSKVRLTKPQLLDLARHVKTASPVDFAPMLGAFSRMRDAEVGEALSAAVAEAPASASMPATELRRHLSRFPAESVATAQERIESLEQAEQKRIAQLEALVPRVQAEGDAERGRQVFQTGLGTCIMCHQIGEMGKDVGPNLTTIGRIREPRDLLESILFPGASIARDFEAYLITMKDGGVHSGVIREENNQVLKLATVGGLTVEVERAAVASMKAAPASLMPMGLDQTLTEQQLLDLVAYLDSLE